MSQNQLRSEKMIPVIYVLALFAIKLQGEMQALFPMYWDAFYRCYLVSKQQRIVLVS